MNDRVENEEITTKELRYCMVICLTGLFHLGYINLSQFRYFQIEFGDECQERGFSGGTSELPNGGALIQINPKISRNKLLETIAHESVHAMQFMIGHAKRVGPGVIGWKGESYTILAGNDPDYDNQPWEEEAYRIAPQNH